MDDFMKNLTSKAPIKPSEISRLSSSTSDLKQRIKEINENDQDLHHHQMSSKLQNSKKPLMAKNFMSPTVSASSKATTPRKKILVERNEASGTIFPDTHFQKRSTHASADLISSPITKLSPRVSEMEETGTDSISQPYDPVTNYLSPRPKFLRYDPNRRRGILHRLEWEMKEGKENGFSGTDTSSDSEKMVEEDVPSDADADGEPSFSSSSSEEGSEKPVDGSSFGLNELELDPPPSKEEDTHESKKPEDGSSSDLKELGLNPSYPSEEEETHENGDEEEDEIEEVEEEKGRNGYLNQVMKFLFLLLVLTVSTLYISSMNSPTPPPALQALRDYKVDYLKIQESVIVWGTTFLDQMQEYNQNLLMENGSHKEEMIEVEWEDEVEEVSDQVDETLELVESEKEGDFLEEIRSTEEKEMIVEGLKEESDQIVELIELNEREISLVPEKEVTLDEILEAESTSLNEEETVVNELEDTRDVTDESHESMEETSVISETSEDLPLIQDSIGAETHSISQPEVTSSEEAEDSELMETELTEKWAIGITVISVILAYIVLKIVQTILSRKSSAKGNSVAFKKPSFEHAVKEKNGGSTQVLLKKEETNAERIEKAAESYVKPSSGIQAPTVELLGEYVVEELNSSFKSCSLKPKTVQCEESIFSVSLDPKPRRMAFSSPINNRERPSDSEFSAIHSPSYGCFTDQEKTGRKEARDGEEVVSTPLRRSSRLRSKSVMSP